MTTFADGKIEVYLGPIELGAPDDLEQVIVDFVHRSTTSLDIAIQEIDNPRIAQAIVDASWRGVDVVMFLEQDYLRSHLTGHLPTRGQARHPTRRCTGSSGSRTPPNSPRTAGSWPGC